MPREFEARGATWENHVHGQFSGCTHDGKTVACLLPMTEFGDALKLPIYFQGLSLGAGTALFGNVPDSISSPGRPPFGARWGVPRRPR